MQFDSNSPIQASETKSKRSGWFFRSLRNVAILAVVFWAGLILGGGGLSLNTPVSSNSDLPDNLTYAEVERVYDILRENYDGELTVEELINGMKKGLVDASGDPYTEYLNPEEAEAFNRQLSGSFSGIGAELGKDDADNLIIVAPIAGFPAEQEGLRPKDIILSIDGTTANSMTINEAVTLIRGEAGTNVKLEILRGESDRREFTITRAQIDVPSVTHEIKEGNVGYIRISQFWNDTPSLVKQAAREFNQRNVEKVVLDLRGNPGGSLDAAVEVASVWLENGKTVLEERRDGEVVQVYKATGTPLLNGIETVVLIDEGSASASEIVAGALSDNTVAQTVGQTSYGKGSVQQIIPLRNGGELKVTIARWYRPSGEDIDKTGIKPDVEVEISEADITNDRDPQLDRAIEILKS